MGEAPYVEMLEAVAERDRECRLVSMIDWARLAGEPELRVVALKECRPYLGIDACHLYPKQRLKVDGFGPDVIYDPRAAVLGCRWHHTLVDAGRLTILRKRLPADFEEWAKQHELEDAIDREYGERLGV